jgi:hypothetical protein
MEQRQPFRVVVRQGHCDYNDIYGICSNFMDSGDCPLFRAIKEQYPDFPLDGVGGTFLLTSDEHDWRIRSDWGYKVAYAVASGELESFTVTIGPKEIRHAIDLHS